MSDFITLLRKVPEGMKTTWKDMKDGTWALVVAARLIGADGSDLSVDSEGALVTISYPHHEVHSGSMFLASYKSPDGADIADNASLDVLIQVGADRTAHIVFSCVAGGDAEVFLYEGTVVSNVGTAMASQNMNRAKTSKIATTAVTHTPTVTTAGIQLANYPLIGGTGPKTEGGESTPRPGTEWIFEKGETYLVRTTNRAGAAKIIGKVLEWYEEG